MPDYDLLFSEIPESSCWNVCREEPSPYAEERRYCVQSRSGDRHWIRLFDPRCYDRVKKEFDLAAHLRVCRIPSPRVHRYGFCAGGSLLYLLQDPPAGCSCTTGLTEQRPEMQYALGMETGRVLKKLHFLDIRESSGSPPISGRSSREIACGELPAELGKLPVCRDLLRAAGYATDPDRAKNRLLAGDFLPDHIRIDADGSVSLADLGACRCGDPCEDLASAILAFAPLSIPFVIGLLDCYFLFTPGLRSLRRIAGYAACRALGDLLGEAAGGISGRLPALRRAQDLNEQYNRFRSVVPRWYKPMPRSMRVTCGSRVSRVSDR